MSSKTYQFSRKLDEEFARTLRQRVNEYFKTRNISRNANFNMVLKTVAMLSMYFVPYFLVVFGVFESWYTVLPLWIVMAFGMSGIGLSIMHDANHGSYSRNKKVNYFLSYLINFVGGNVANWRVQHNVLHHTYTNIQGADEDLDGPGFLRFSPHAKAQPIHRYQHIYAWFFYMLMTLSWATAKEFIQIKRFRRNGMIKDTNRYRWIMAGLWFWKVFYFAYTLVIPIIFSPVAAWFTVMCFFIMHFISGFILSVIFQSAHIMENCEFPQPDDNQINNNFIVHQLLNTTNFAPKNRVLSWFAGGLNYQIEHHLFPDICHIHYKKISKIVQETASQFDLPYYTIPSFRQAVKLHGRMLRKLGKDEFSAKQLTESN